MASDAKKFEKLMKNQLWNFRKIIAFKTSLVWLQNALELRPGVDIVRTTASLIGQGWVVT